MGLLQEAGKAMEQALTRRRMLVHIPDLPGYLEGGRIDMAKAEKELKEGNRVFVEGSRVGSQMGKILLEITQSTGV